MDIKHRGLSGFIESCIRDGLSCKESYEKAIELFGYENTLNAFRKSYSRVKINLEYDNSIEDFSLFTKENKKSSKSIEDEYVELLKQEEFVELLKRRKVISGEEACNILDCEAKDIYNLTRDLRKKGLDIYCDDKKIFLSNQAAPVENNIDTLACDEIVFGIASDLHFGSRHCQITHLNTFAEICRKKGVKHILVPGDVFAGYNVYRGQMFEVYAVSSKEQEDSAIVNLPTGFQWYMLGGNHDYSFMRNGGGHNPLLVLENQRPDVHYLGFDEADIPLLPGVDCRLWHPSGGIPYSVSYKMQKAVEQISYSELAKVVRSQKAAPSIRFLLCGHLHIQVQAMFGSIFAAQCGTFEGQTGYLKSHGLHPVVGGYIIHAKLRKKDGMILNFNAKFYIFPEEIKDDWKNYKHSLDESKKIKPIFS